MGLEPNGEEKGKKKKQESGHTNEAQPGEGAQSGGEETERKRELAWRDRDGGREREKNHA